MPPSDTPEAPDERVGQVLLGKLEVIRRIGGGGMGDVYEVEHLITRHRRALKIVRAEYARQRRYVERLLREASVAGRLKTPYVVETLDAGRLEDDSGFILMELLEGVSLHEMIHGEGTLSQRRLASIMTQVAEGLGVAHAAGIVHRDLKPENVFVAIDPETGVERVKILDFGVSKMLEPEEATRLTREGTVLGTPFYMAPEQASGRDIDGRTDVWAMGVVMYEALTGKLPFWGDTIGEVFIAIGAGHYVPVTVRRPDVDPAFAAVIDRALEPDPALRYPSAEAMRRELIPFASNDPIARGKTISDAPAAPRVDRSPRSGPTATPNKTIEDGIAAGRAARRSSRPPPEMHAPIVVGSPLPDPHPAAADSPAATEPAGSEPAGSEPASTAPPSHAPPASEPRPRSAASPAASPGSSPSIALVLPTRSRIPLVAGLLVVAALAITSVAWWSSATETAVPVAAAPARPETPEREPEPDRASDPPARPRIELVAEPAMVVPDAGTPRAVVRRPPSGARPRTPAEIAGLEGNPYGTP